MRLQTFILTNIAFVAAILVTNARAGDAPAAPASRPNVVLLFVDDLGWGDLGCYGQKKIRTPNLDRMAAEGTRFTSGYVSTSVCAPSRCGLLTGMHMGHAAIRANREVQPEGQMPLPKGTFTMGHLFKNAGYATAVVGKWGLGFPGSGSEPKDMGFDHFYGYNCQRHAHSYFPAYLRSDDERLELDGKTYAHDLIEQDALKFIRTHAAGDAAKPFFLFFAITLPHGKFEIPDQGPYAAEDWPAVGKNYAAMVSRLDTTVGRVLDLLKETKADQNTLVLFMSDNGPTPQFATQFDSNGPLRGIKREMYEGGLRVPFLARWPGQVPAGRVSDGPIVTYDLLPTFADLIGEKLPAEVKVDGLSLVKTFKGGDAPPREYFYWELHEGGAKQAVRFDDWKAVKPGPKATIELYDLKADIGESKNVAAAHPDLAKKAEAYMKEAHTPSPLWPLEPQPKKPAGK